MEKIKESKEEHELPINDLFYLKLELEVNNARLKNVFELISLLLDGLNTEKCNIQLINQIATITYFGKQELAAQDKCFLKLLQYIN